MSESERGMIAVWNLAFGISPEALLYDLIYIYEFEGDLTSEFPKVKDEDYVGFWKESGYSFLFFRKPKKRIMEQLPVPLRSELFIRHEDWESGTPIGILHVGNILLHPPWINPPAGDAARICIDPGMAFGSGYHPSTRNCLTLLQRLFAQHVPGRVLDLGCGTGILSIACLKLGSETAYAIDNNNLSIDVARTNRLINDAAGHMHLVMGNAADFLHIPADILLANIHYTVIDELTRHELFYTKEYCLVSGLLGSEGHRIEERLKDRLELVDTCSENFWFTYLFRNKSQITMSKSQTNSKI